MKNIKEKSEEELSSSYWLPQDRNWFILIFIRKIKKSRIEILPRFKIQYPMKNRGKDKKNTLHYSNLL